MTQAHEPPAVGYCRVSTKEQALNSNALENQIARVRAVIGEDAPLFVDQCSGTKSNRPEFLRMVKFLESGRYQRVIVTRIDRLGRNSRDGFHQVLAWWTSTPQIRTVCLDYPVDLEVLGGRMNLSMMVEASVFEVDMLSTRIRASTERNFLNGKAFQPPPFGYIRTNGNFFPDREVLHCPIGQKPDRPGDFRKKRAGGEIYPGISSAELARLLILSYMRTTVASEAIAEMMPYALTQTKTTARLHMFDGVLRHLRPSFPPTATQVIQMAFHPVYRGVFAGRPNYNAALRPANGEKTNTYKRTNDTTYEFYIENHHEAIITDEEYQKLLAIRARNEGSCQSFVTKKRQSTKRFAHPLVGLLFCDCCGQRLRPFTPGRHGRGQTTTYFRCRNDQCDNYGVSIQGAVATTMVLLYLRELAAKVQAGEAELPEGDSAVDTRHLAELRATLDALQSVPDRRRVASAIKDVEAEIRQIEGEPDKNAFLYGTAKQLLLSPEAADLTYWEAFMRDDPIQTGLRLQRLLKAVRIGYAKPEDRPVLTPGPRKRGRRPVALAGKPAVLGVSLR